MPAGKLAGPQLATLGRHCTLSACASFHSMRRRHRVHRQQQEGRGEGRLTVCDSSSTRRCHLMAPRGGNLLKRGALEGWAVPKPTARSRSRAQAQRPISAGWATEELQASSCSLPHSCSLPQSQLPAPSAARASNPPAQPAKRAPTCRCARSWPRPRPSCLDCQCRWRCHSLRPGWNTCMQEYHGMEGL